MNDSVVQCFVERVRRKGNLPSQDVFTVITQTDMFEMKGEPVDRCEIKTTKVWARYLLHLFVDTEVRSRINVVERSSSVSGFVFITSDCSGSTPEVDSY